jgi:hypothetical protein
MNFIDKINQDTNWFNKIMAYVSISSLTISIIAILFYFMLINTQSAATIVYIIVLISLTVGVTSVIVFILSNLKSNSFLSQMKDGVRNTWTLWLMLVPIVLTAYLVITNRERIAEDRVSSGYYTFSFISLIIMMLQIYHIFSSVSKTSDKNQEAFTKLSTISSYIIGMYATLNLICSITIYVILTMFTTDG